MAVVCPNMVESRSAAKVVEVIEASLETPHVWSTNRKLEKVFYNAAHPQGTVSKVSKHATVPTRMDAPFKYLGRRPLSLVT